METVHARVMRLRDEMGITPKQLSDVIGVSVQSISNWKHTRNRIADKNIARLAAFFGVSPAYIRCETDDRDGIGPIGKTLSKSKFEASMNIKSNLFSGRLAAGVWAAQDAETTQSDAIGIPALPSRYPHLPQVAYRSASNSMDLEHIFDGDYVICVPFSETRGHARNAIGDIIVIERRQGGLIERSCRKVQVAEGRIELAARSSDPQWRAPIVVDESDHPADGIDLAIVGLVVGTYRPF